MSNQQETTTPGADCEHFLEVWMSGGADDGPEAATAAEHIESCSRCSTDAAAFRQQAARTADSAQSGVE